MHPSLASTLALAADLSRRMPMLAAPLVFAESATAYADNNPTQAVGQQALASTQAPSVTPSPPMAASPPAAAPEADPLAPFKISGKTYADVSFNENVDEAANTRQKTTGFDMKRLYLGIGYQASPVYSATFLTDIGDQDGHYDVYVKKAFVQAKFFPAFILRAGVGDTPWVPWAEDVYGFRYVENTLIDRTHYGTSADWGLHALGTFADGRAGYQLSIVNGNGYANPSRAKVPAVELRVDSRPFGGLVLGVGGSVSTLGAENSVPHTGWRFDALVGWVVERLRVGIEGFVAYDYTADQVAGKAPEDTARGLSAFATFRFLPKLGVFGRLDYVQPFFDTDSRVKDRYFNAGFDYSPYEFLDLALVYKRDTVNSGNGGVRFGTTNGKIGSTVPNQSGYFQEAGVFSQFKF
jgi:hypothetical protein